jgi:methyl-accepting chemotaxis protein
MPEGGVVGILITAVIALFAVVAYFQRWSLARLDQTLDVSSKQIAQLIDAHQKQMDSAAHARRVESAELISMMRSMRESLEAMHRVEEQQAKAHESVVARMEKTAVMVAELAKSIAELTQIVKGMQRA